MAGSEKDRRPVQDRPMGGVTNYADLKVLGEATTHDLIEARLWSTGNGGAGLGLGFRQAFVATHNPDL